MINPNIDWNQVQREFEDCGISVIDNFTDAKTIGFLRDFALNVPYRDTYYDGYSALEFDKTSPFPCLMETLIKGCESSVSVLQGKLFSRGWFFIYDSLSGGVGIHIDPLSDITINIWVTPEDCVDGGKGFNGLDIWKIEPKPEWGFEISVHDSKTCAEYINEKQAEMVSVDYRFNRAVIFNSKYFHRSQPVKFKQGLENRKINYALLFNADGN